MDTILQGVDRSGSEHHTLPSDAIEDLLGSDPQGGQLAMGELQKDLLLLISDKVDLLDIVDLQEPLASLLAHPLELGQRIIVSCKRVNGAVDIPILVVDARSDQARWQLPSNVVEFLADLIPSIRNILASNRVLDLNKRHHPVCDAVGQKKVELGRLPEFVLDATSDVALHLFGGGSWPNRSDNHRLDRKGGVFGSPHLPIGRQTRDAACDHQKPNKRWVRDRPSREVPTKIAREQLTAIRVVVVSWKHRESQGAKRRKFPLLVILPYAHAALRIDPLNPGADDQVTGPQISSYRCTLAPILEDLDRDRLDLALISHPPDDR